MEFCLSLNQVLKDCLTLFDEGIEGGGLLTLREQRGEENVEQKNDLGWRYLRQIHPTAIQQWFFLHRGWLIEDW